MSKSSWKWWRSHQVVMAPRRGRRRRGGPRRRERLDLVRETEAFLGGRLAEMARGRSVELPVWTWTNLLAHGSRGELEVAARQALVAQRKGSLPERKRPLSRLAGGDRHWGRSVEGQWRHARAVLALEVLRCAQGDSSLEEIQRTVLVPLEQELAFDPAAARWRPVRWVIAVEAALTRHSAER